MIVLKKGGLYNARDGAMAALGLRRRDKHTSLLSCYALFFPFFLLLDLGKFGSLHRKRRTRLNASIVVLCINGSSEN